jgi:hypothetical protein
VVLDSADYDPFTITQSVSVISPPGVFAGINVIPSSGNGNGVTINATQYDMIVLRGLNIHTTDGSQGIMYNSGAVLHVESCVVEGFGGDGISFLAPGSLFVKDTISRNNSTGIRVLTNPGAITATIDQVRLERNTDGLVVAGGAKATIRNSVMAENEVGVRVLPYPLAAAEANIENCMIANNQVGVSAENSDDFIGLARVSNSTVTNNGTGLWQFGGILLSRGNNTVEGNAFFDTRGTIGSYTAR